MMSKKEQQIYTELPIIRCQQGEKEAFELIVELWQKPLLSFARRYIDQEAEAWDAVQETWISVVKGLNKLQNPSLFVSWLFRIMTNKCIDRVRKKQTEKNLLRNANIKSQPSETPNESDSLSKAIERLSDEQKTLIMLRYGQEMTEELEKKLNELLGLKKQVEELTEDKKKSDASSVFEEKKRKTKVYFYICFAVTLGIMLFGVIGIFMNTGKYQIISLFYAVLGFESNVLIKLWYHTIATKLAILQEMKQFELRIMEMLKK